MTKVGTRVLALLDAREGVVRSFGEGVYAGDFVPPEDIGFGIPNPRIDLDNGKVVWGMECWWGDVDSVRKRFQGEWKWEQVDPETIRTP